ncbi:uncharacterized protein NPIL_445021 [Nephila pilipes]|uniref:Uncharacterized protein n=1 Tax=Nephila pilipes TaxID=299642 RepID=A0A8X6TZT5_NEPPI|nr:uncharacterized protein NPIL_445021 [Nephila pilipes]
MRSSGRGAEDGRLFCALKNLPQSLTRFVPYNKRLLNGVNLVSEKTMQNSAQEAVRENRTNNNNAVEVDGHLQNRSYTSLNSVVTTISLVIEKIIDAEILLSTVCALINIIFKRNVYLILMVIVGRWKLKVLHEYFNVH